MHTPNPKNIRPKEYGIKINGESNTQLGQLNYNSALLELISLHVMKVYE